MQKTKQATLFRAWGGSKVPKGDGNAQNSSKTSESLQKPSHTASNALAIDRGTSGASVNNVDGAVTDEEREHYGFNDVQQLEDFFEDDISQEKALNLANGGAACSAVDDPVSVHNTSILEDVPGFDAEAGRRWIYPTNYPLRDYQFNIVQKCLFRNTLVCLPTGLGKTFIAAVVMFNFYRWYPEGKVVFLAPTKPLVGQQIEACHNIMGIPQDDLAEMTGNKPPKERASQWRSKRVFFLTPQVMQNDITRGAYLAGQVCCVVFDEAHKALGNYSYCQVVRELNSCGTVFRVLALSATPGNDLKAVQQVVSNLHLSHIELRAEDSFDIQPYTHHRKVELNVVPLEGEILVVKNTFLKVLSAVVGRLAKHGVVYSANPERLSKFGLLQARDGFRQNPPSGVHPGTIEADFAAAISLYHAFDLLVQHGMRSFHQYLTHTFTTPYSRTRAEVDRHSELSRIMRDLHGKLTGRTSGVGQVGTGRIPRHSPSTSITKETTFFYSHPKLEKLEEVVLEHFHRFSDQSTDGASGTATVATRVMIFSQYRESVQEIADMLLCHAPLVRVMSFVGHATSGKSTSKGLTQKEQTEVVRKFREGGYNTLVATCVGEEGLDIGEVDLIVCFDAHKSPIRLVQRMGRTGRKRSGRIVVIVAQGKEEQIYRKSQSNKSSIHKAIRDHCRSLHFYPHAPRMVPRHITPECVKMHMNVREFVSSKSAGTRGRGTGRGTGRQPRLSMGPPVPSRASRRGCLNDEELAEWIRDYALPDRELKACERAVKVCFKPHPLLGLSHLQRGAASHGIQATPPSNQTTPNCNSSTTQLNSTVTRKYPLNLSKWVRWQTAQTHFKMVGPSEKSKQFVSLLEFLDLMHSCEGLGDNYSTEMATFLNHDDIHEVGGDTGEVGERVMMSSRRRRRVLSDSSDDGDFRDDVRGEEGGDKTSSRDETTGDMAQQEKEMTSPLDTEEAVEKQLSPSLPSEETMPVTTPPPNRLNGRGSLTQSQHVIPRPPSCESLDWLDNIEPSQVSTPLPSSSSSHHHSHSHRPHPSHQFAIPRTPPSSRKGKTPFVKPLTAPLPPIHSNPTESHMTPPRSHMTPPRSHMTSPGSHMTSDSRESHVEMSVDMFSDTPSGVLFADLSHQRLSVHWDPNITCIPDSEEEEELEEGEREGEEREEREREAERGAGSSKKDISCLRDSCDNSDLLAEEVHVSDESLIGGGGRRQRTTPDFLLTQAPLSSPRAHYHTSPRAHSHTSPRAPLHSVMNSDRPLNDRKRKCGQEMIVIASSDDEDDEFIVPMRRKRRIQGDVCSSEGVNRGTEEVNSAGRRAGEDHLWKEFEFLDEEAELSEGGGGRGWGRGGEEEEEKEEGGDGYDLEDSFINDNSVLTQITPSQKANKRKPGKKRFSPVNMADVYRRSLMSPTTPLRGRERGRGNRYRMVLSQRHHILHHYMEKARRRGRGGRREGGEGEMLEGEEGADVSSEEGAEGRSVSGEEGGEVSVEEGAEERSVSGEEGGDGSVSGESEAEEVMVRYGEEDVDEIADSQSMGEPWDWEEDQEMSQEQEMETRETDEQWVVDQLDVVSPSLLHSVELHSTPSCYTIELEVEGWLSDECPTNSPLSHTHTGGNVPCTTPNDGNVPSPTAEEPPVPVLSAGVTDDVISTELTAEEAMSSQHELEEGCNRFCSEGSPESIPQARNGLETNSTLSTHPPLTFLTSSTEAAHTQVVSQLRHRHHVCVLVCPLSHGGYVVSDRTVVVRREMEDVGTANSVGKTITKLQELQQLYSRVHVIIEQDVTKEGRKTWSRPIHTEMAVSRFHSADIGILFSQSQTHSASLLVSLGSTEAKRGHSISLTECHVNCAHPVVMKLLQQVPDMAYHTALYLSSTFKSLAELLTCSPAELKERVPSLSERRARKLTPFFKHSFNHHLVS